MGRLVGSVWLIGDGVEEDGVLIVFSGADVGEEDVVVVVVVIVVTADRGGGMFVVPGSLGRNCGRVGSRCSSWTRLLWKSVGDGG